VTAGLLDGSGLGLGGCTPLCMGSAVQPAHRAGDVCIAAPQIRTRQAAALRLGVGEKLGDGWPVPGSGGAARSSRKSSKPPKLGTSGRIRANSPSGTCPGSRRPR
jgi:hypothetical protein